MKSLLSLLLMSGSAFAWQPITNLNQVASEIKTQLPGVEPQRVLLVFDIDETLLQTPEYYGSSEWFSDHVAQLKSSEFAESFPELLAHNAMIQNSIEMVPTQPDTKDIVKALQDVGYPSMALTSRGSAQSVAAIAQLRKIGVSFYHQLNIATTLATDPQPAYTVDTIATELGVTQTRAAEMGLAKPPRAVSWMYGVLFITGQNKGGLLRWFLKSSSNDFDAIVFVDDTLKNVKSVEDAFVDTRLKVLSLHYLQVAPAAKTHTTQGHSRAQELEFLHRFNFKAKPQTPATNSTR